ncbi:MAG: cysteine hydrolase [Candidatus Promineofilum sp.]|nr:cysteine hydrolase [Promineifilum sp.]
MTIALLLIDAQVNMFAPDPVHDGPVVLSRLKELAGRARAAGVPVIFVRHNGGPDDPDAPHTPGWAIHPALAPAADEAIIDKHTPDAFHQTGLAGVLAERGIRRLVLAGMQTEYCIDTTTRRARSLGYEVVLAADAHSTYPGALPAEQVIAHHNSVLKAFADVRPAAEIDFQAAPPPVVTAEALTTADLAAIQSGLEEWRVYEQWLKTGEGHPFWPHTHPARISDTLRSLWEPSFKPRARYTDPPRWEMGVARVFLQPLANIPMVFRRASLTAVNKAIDHLLQNPRNPLSPHMSAIGEHVWLYDARDLRLIYVPSVVHDKDGRERHTVFLLWLAPGIPVKNPFLQ